MSIDTEKALKAGIITPDQAAAIEGLNTDAPVIGAEDDMRFLRSFSDVFIGIGLVLLALGLSALTALFGGGVLYLMSAVGVYLMAEYFGRKKRAHFPTLILALLFLVFVQRGFGALMGGSGILAALITVGAMSIFYWRIRLPFCVALIAVSLIGLAFTLIPVTGWTVAGAGVAVFIAALLYDRQDRHRTTRFADNAFWLHFIAAPLIIHGIAMALLTTRVELLFDVIPMVDIGRGDAAILLGVVAIIMIVGLAINRRALIVSSLGYAGFALAYLFDGTGLGLSASVTGALLALGATIVLLGVGWHPVRNQLIRLLPKWRIFPPPFVEGFKG